MTHDWHMERSIPVTESGCWIWLGCTDGKGYGLVTISRKTHRAHRASWAIENGEIPKDAQILHKCDTPSCINPSHLFLGNNTLNMADKVLKGRQAKGAMIGDRMHGEKQHMAKLTMRQAADIRSSSRRGVDLAKQYGVSQATISAIKRGKSWVRAGERNEY